MSAGMNGEWVYGITAVLAIVVASIMFSDTLRGSMDMASAGVRYLYDKTASSVLGQGADLGPLTKWERKHMGAAKNSYVGGLYNEGNTCFMNSVIQSLASCGSLWTFLEDNYKDKQENTEKIPDVQEVSKETPAHVASGENQLRNSLLALINQLNIRKTSNHTYSTATLTRAIAELTHWRYTRYTQEDAQEFFQQILLGMEKEMERSGLKLDKKNPNTPFDGTQATRVGCVKCGEMDGIRRGLLSSIDLNLSSETSGSISLEDLLNEYTTMETIPGVECYRCSLIDYEQELTRRSQEGGPMGKMFESRVQQIQQTLSAKVIDEKQYAQLKPSKLKVLGDKTKQVMLGQPTSEVIMVHINRSVFDMRTGYMGKNYTPVVFPMHLDVSPWVISNDDNDNSDPKCPMRGLREEPIRYELRATVIHYGSANFGHYVCFRKDAQGIWWRISDNNVDLSSAQQVQRSQGVFMLFYERWRGTDQELSMKDELASEDEQFMPTPTPTPTPNGTEYSDEEEDEELDSRDMESDKSDESSV